MENNKNNNYIKINKLYFYILLFYTTIANLNIHNCSTEKSNTPVLYSIQSAARNAGESDVGKGIFQALHLNVFGTIALWYGMSEGLSNFYHFAEQRWFSNKIKNKSSGIQNILFYLLKHITILTLMIMYEGKLISNPAEATTKTSSILENANEINYSIEEIGKKIVYDYNHSSNINLSINDINKIKQLIETQPLLKKFIIERTNHKDNNLTELQKMINNLL